MIPHVNRPFIDHDAKPLATYMTMAEADDYATAHAFRVFWIGVVYGCVFSFVGGTFIAWLL